MGKVMDKKPNWRLSSGKISAIALLCQNKQGGGGADNVAYARKMHWAPKKKKSVEMDCSPKNDNSDIIYICDNVVWIYLRV